MGEWMDFYALIIGYVVMGVGGLGLTAVIIWQSIEQLLSLFKFKRTILISYNHYLKHRAEIDRIKA